MKTQFLRDPLTKEEWLEILTKAIEDKKIDLTYKSAISINLSDLIINQYCEKFKPPQLLIMTSAYLKMMSLVQSTDKEIAWHGIVEKREDTLVITDILVYPQETTGTTADADEDAYGPWIVKNHKVVNRLRMQGHSHVNMSVFASGTDMDSFKKLMAQVKDYYIFLIVNKKWEIKCYYADVASGIFYEDVPILIATKEPFNLAEWTREQMTHVKAKSYARSNTGYPVNSYPLPPYDDPYVDKKKHNTKPQPTLASEDPDEDYTTYPLNKKYTGRKIG